MRFVHRKFFIYAQILMYKRKLMRRLGVFQQAGPFLAIVKYNGPKNLNTARGRNKIYSKQDEKTIYSCF